MEGGSKGNDYALKYKDAKELQEKINNYFAKCDEEHRPYTICGLALFLGVHRETILNYSKREEYADIISAAKLRIETQLEESLYRLGNNSGVIFNLKNNYGWKDTVEVKNNHSIGRVEELLDKIEEEAKKWY